jgi:hypothetical protein
MEVLTVKRAMELKGKTIAYSAWGDSANGEYTGKITVGGVVSEWDYYKTQPCPGYESRTAYWEARLKESAKNEIKSTMLLVDENGEYQPYFIKAYCGAYSYFEEDTFTLSDADRPVFFKVL